MQASIAQSIRRFQHLDNVRSVAVLTKWRQAAKDICESLESMGIEDVRVLASGGTVETDVTVTPILLTKGLEFDAVIVANAGKRNFGETVFNRLLLYMACTRARHHLEIHWNGTPVVHSSGCRASRTGKYCNWESSPQPHGPANGGAIMCLSQ